MYVFVDECEREHWRERGAESEYHVKRRGGRAYNWEVGRNQTVC